jgi:outer membrane protein assembly factor BamD
MDTEEKRPTQPASHLCACLWGDRKHRNCNSFEQPYFNTKPMVKKYDTKKLISVCLCYLFLLTSCATYNKVRDFIFKPKDLESVEVLVQNGMDEFESGDYKAALENFQKLKDWYPFSKYVTLAELKIADSHYHLEEYAEAILAYREFADLHPNNEAVPYVIYQIGRCNFDQMDAIDRDQSVTRKALDTFLQLQRQYPNSLYAERATEHINKCLKNLAGNEFYIAMFYYKNKRYDAALQRFKAIVIKYPDVGVNRIALQYIAKCETSLAKLSQTE